MSGYGQAYPPPAAPGGYGYNSAGGGQQSKKPRTVGGNSSGYGSSSSGYGSSATPSYATSYDKSMGGGSSAAAAATAADSSYSAYGYDYSSYYSNQAYYSTNMTQQPPLPKDPPKSHATDDSWSNTGWSNNGYSTNTGTTSAYSTATTGQTNSIGPAGWGVASTGGSAGGRGNNRGGGRGRGGRGRGRGGNMIGPKKPEVIKPKGPPPMTNEQKARIENHNLKQLVAPKPPHKILNEMMGGKVAFTYTENPPLPPGTETFEEMHTLAVTIDEVTSSGTGPSHDIAKNICSEHAIMGVVQRRYEAINEMVTKGMKSKDELLLEDETPFELASMAIFKMLNEWEANGYELPQDLEDILYTSHLYLPVKERLSWIRGSNLGYFTPLEGPNVQGVNKRKKPMRMPSEQAICQKNPIAFLNEIRGNVDYTELGAYGQMPNVTFSVGVNIDGVPYSGTGMNKKEAKKNCAIDVLQRLYRITVPETEA